MQHSKKHNSNNENYGSDSYTNQHYINNNQANDAATLEEKNALATAQDYLQYSYSSKQRLIEKLEYEKFEDDAINYALNNLNINWNEQCYQNAKYYSEYSSPSKQKMIEHLQYEKFTNEQINYALEKLGY